MKGHQKAAARLQHTQFLLQNFILIVYDPRQKTI